MKNEGSIFKPLGASNHCDHERQNEDFYATPPSAVEWLLRLEQFDGPILEPACGMGHISHVLENAGYTVVSRDIVDRGCGEVSDFLSIDNQRWDGDIITNPPYEYAQDFVEKSLQIIPTGHKVAMFLKLTFLEGKARRSLFAANPPRVLYVSSSRFSCAMNGDFSIAKSSAVAYGWFVWQKGFNGDPIIKWFN